MREVAELRAAMRKAKCDTDFINFVVTLVKYQDEIDWNDYATEIGLNEVSLRLINGYVITVR